MTGGDVSRAHVAACVPLEPLVEIAFDGLIVTTAEMLVYANPAFASMLGYTPAELVGSSPLELVVPECRDALRVKLSRREPTNYEVTALHRNGEHLAVVARTRPEGDEWVTATQDVTRTRRVLEDLRQSEGGFRRVVEQHPDMVMVHRGGVILFANPVLLRYLGYAELSQVVGTRTAELWPTRSLGAQTVWEALGEPGPMSVPWSSLPHVRPDGSVGVVEVVSLPTEFDGQPATLTIARDVHARKQQAQRLVAAELMASVGRLAAAVNHEINNPLTYLAITGALVAKEIEAAHAALSEHRLTDAELALEHAAERTAELREGTERVTDVARDFKALSSVHSDRLEVLDVRELIPSTVRIAQVEVLGRAQIELRLPAVAPVRVNPGRLGQVLLNLLVNAAQAMPETGKHVILVSTSHSGPDVVIDVDDNGPGIPAENADRVFEPLFSTKQVGPASGLGLPISRDLVEAMGGTLTLEGSPLGGARFRIRLPAVHSATEAPSATQH
jgi:PAS domain S-box-containing protein